MTQYSGKIIRKNPVAPTQQSASGVWTTADAAAAVKNNNWPVAGVPNPISRSVRTRLAASAYFNRTPSVASNRKTFTWSSWVKIGQLGLASNPLFGGIIAGTSNVTEIAFNASNQLDFFSQNTAGTVIGRRTTTQVFRDPSAWYHIVVVIDTTAATAADRIKIYVNGSQVTNFAASTDFSLNDNTGINDTTVQRIAGRASGTYFFDGYLTEINFIDGQALTPSSFGTTDSITGAWVPMPYTGTYGTNGFYLNFKDNTSTTTIGYDYSGNSNNWTANNISLTAGVTYDSMVDVPTLWMPYNTAGDVGATVRGNYATLNPLYKGSNVTPTEGNLKFGMTAGNFHEGITGTIFPTSGKWYAEFRWNAVTANTTATAVCRNNAAMNNITCAFQNTVDTNSPTFRSYIVNGNKDTNTTSAAYGSTYTANDTIGVALDLDNGKVWFSKNGAWQASGDPAAGTNAAFTDITGSDGWTFGVSGYGSGGDNCQANFGQQPFTYTPPTGFKALNTFNLPAPTINNGASYMAATLYTGNGSTQTVNNSAGFYPDFNWIKNRNNVGSHVLVNSVVGGTKQLFSNLTNAEQTDTNITNGISASGIALGNNSTGTGSTNQNTYTYVLWQWLAGAGSSSSNTSGSITSTVSVNATAGFSIVTYTGNGTNPSTVGHGLGVAPKMMIFKDRSGVANWPVYHASLGNTSALLLDTTGASTATVNWWNNTSPTSSVFTIGSNENPSGRNHVAYCFAEVAGFSKFGSYTGNGSADGPFVYCGFRPRWVMIKRTDSAGFDWNIIDTSRNTYNVTTSRLWADLSNAEDSTDNVCDITSNGFKLRSTNTNTNASGGTYIFMAFAENPFKYSNAR